MNVLWRERDEAYIMCNVDIFVTGLNQLHAIGECDMEHRTYRTTQMTDRGDEEAA